MTHDDDVFVLGLNVISITNHLLLLRMRASINTIPNINNKLELPRPPPLLTASVQNKGTPTRYAWHRPTPEDHVVLTHQSANIYIYIYIYIYTVFSFLA